jgi:hypothetical protein
VIVDAEEDFFRALKRAGLTQEQLDVRLEAAVERVLARRDEKLEPLAAIIGVKTDTARKMVARDKGLRDLGVPRGRSYVFRRSAVVAYLADKKRGAR